MPPRISNYIFSLLLALAGMTYAQDAIKKDSVRQSFKPTGVRIGTDAITLVKNFSTEDFTGWEVSADVDLRNYYPTLEIGHWEQSIALENGHYANSGNYWRIGSEINLLKKDPVKNMFFVGFRLGHSKYDEQLNYLISTPEFGTISKTLANNGLTSNWMEFTTGLKVRVLKSFWMGYTARIKFAAMLHENLQLQTYDIPGYGLTFKKPWWGFNYYLMFRMPLQKKK
jgi:hypothetical protein